MSEVTVADASRSIDVVEMTAEVVGAYVAHNSIPTGELPALLQSVHQALASLANPVAPVEAKPREPAVSVRKSVTDEYIVCLEDGKRFKSLKRHLHTSYGLSPQEYRAKWNLPVDYPMVAPAYATARSNLAKTMGLGRLRLGSAAREAVVEAAPEPVAEALPEAAKSPKRGRSAKVSQAAAA